MMSGINIKEYRFTLRMPRLNKRLLAVSILGTMLGAGAAHAQKFAIINMQQAVLATSEGQKARAAIDAKFTPVKNQLDQMSKDIIAKQDAFTKGRATMTPDALTKAQTEIATLTTALQRRQQDAQQDLEEEENKQLGTIVPKLQQVINQYAALNQIMFVMDTSANPNNIIYGHQSLNIIEPVVLAFEKAAAPAPGAATPPAATTTTPKPPVNSAPKTPATTAPKTPAATTPAPKATPTK
jgi:outer membrane protein